MADLDAALNAYLVEPLVKREQYRTLTTPADAGGLGIRRQKWQSPVYTFELRAVFPTSAAASSFLTFWEGKKGGRTSFSWTCPRDAQVYTCVFAEDELAEEWTGHDAWEYAFTLRATR